MSNYEHKDVSATDDVYSQALEKAKKELASLREERQKLTIRIEQLEVTVRGLSAMQEEQKAEVPGGFSLLTDDAKEQMARLGLTNGIRKILSSRTTPMMATEIRDALAGSGMDLTKYSSALVAVHNTLKRLYEQGELARSKDEPTRYVWLNTMARVLRESDRAMTAMMPTVVPKDFETR